MRTLERRDPPPLPSTVEELEEHRKVRFDINLNDRIEALHLRLWPNEQYKRYLYATWDEQAVEGSLAIDNGKAAEMIRDLAKSDDPTVAKEKLATIVKSLSVVLRRFGESRKERRHRVHGETVPSDNGGE